MQTHNIALASPIADFVVAMKDGQILSQGSLDTALAKDAKLSAAIAKQTEQLEKTEQETVAAKPDTTAAQNAGKLVVAEEISEGHVGWSARKYTAGLSRSPKLTFCSQTLIREYGNRIMGFTRLLALLPSGYATGDIRRHTRHLGAWAMGATVRNQDPARVAIA